MTPTLPVKMGGRIRITIVAALVLELPMRVKDFPFRLLVGESMNTDRFLEFLSQLLETIPGKLLIVLDNLNVHKAVRVKAFEADHAKRLELCFLPPYAPELNPVEYGWSYLKSHEVANFAASNAVDLERMARSKCRAIRKRPGLLRSFLAHAPLSFVS